MYNVKKSPIDCLIHYKSVMSLVGMKVIFQYLYYSHVHVYYYYCWFVSLYNAHKLIIKK